MSRPITVVMSIDTEEDNWPAVRRGITVENIRQLPRLGELFRSFGGRPTFFTTYQVGVVPWAAALVQEVANEAGGEMGAHLHPWNTPPLEGPEPKHFTMLNNYPPGLALARLQTLTETLTTAWGSRPTSFRAGRFGLGRSLVRALIKLGYTVDSSVTPLLDWRNAGGGPEYIDAPWEAYRLGLSGSVVTPSAGGPLIELPLTVGFTGLSPRYWRGLAALLQRRGLRRTHLFGVLTALRLMERVIVSPETNSTRQMIAVGRKLVDFGATHLHLFLHSSSLLAGLTPFGRTKTDVDRLYARISSFVEGLGRVAEPVFRTVGEAGLELAPVRTKGRGIVTYG